VSFVASKKLPGRRCRNVHSHKIEALTPLLKLETLNLNKNLIRIATLLFVDRACDKSSSVANGAI